MSEPQKLYKKSLQKFCLCQKFAYLCCIENHLKIKDMKTKIDLIDGTDVQLYTFIQFMDEDTMKILSADGYFNGDMVIDFWMFCYNDLQNLFNKFITDGYAEFLFEGFSENLQKYAKKYVATFVD
jgi:hypothetical protein